MPRRISGPADARLIQVGRDCGLVRSLSAARSGDNTGRYVSLRQDYSFPPISRRASVGRRWPAASQGNDRYGPPGRTC